MFSISSSMIGILSPNVGLNDFGIFHNLAGRAGPNHLAEINRHHMRHQLHELAQPVLNKQNRHALVLGQIANQLRKCGAYTCIQRTQGLIEQQQAR